MTTSIERPLRLLCLHGYRQTGSSFEKDRSSEESLKAVESCFKDSGPFDGILGFSQGAAMLGLLCGLQQQGKLPFSFKFAIFASAFRSGSSPHQHLYSKRITLPSLHIFGETDQVISMSEDLLQLFDEPYTLVHPGGHFIPATAAQKTTYVQFLENMRQLCDV
ncbi:esterase OVCA2-like [Homarus americanus]|uniref:esterase OVCA2-like n=1 Tax=Homarus americanus TaxID=6706 RepID=UPI001C4659E1|nr:esterase OVCA2-like [Homarus americanus]